jgi:hypothetical protein
VDAVQGLGRRADALDDLLAGYWHDIIVDEYSARQVTPAGEG